MKKLLFLVVAVLLVLAGCGNDEPDKLSEMSVDDAKNYLYEVTIRYIDATMKEDGYFEQKSEAQAAIGRSESITEEIKETYKEGLPIAEDLIKIAEQTKEYSEDLVNENFDNTLGKLYLLEEEAKTFADEYLGGEVPEPLEDILLYRATN